MLTNEMLCLFFVSRKRCEHELGIGVFKVAPTVAGFTTNVKIYQDTTAWYDYDALLIGVPGTTGLQNSSTASAIFLGLGATALVTDITTYYSTEDDPATVNTILMTENSQILTQE